MERKTDLEKKGAAQAALLGAAVGLITLSLVNLATAMSGAFQSAVHGVGKFWMPGAEGIGPYSGKETIALVAWLISWFVLNRILRDREWNHHGVLGLFLAGIAVATTLIWPPVLETIAHH